MKLLDNEMLEEVNGGVRGVVITEDDLADAYQDDLKVGQTVKVIGKNGGVGTISQKKKVGKHYKYFVVFSDSTSPDWFDGPTLIRK